ncbi:hypothetical protein GAGA_0025 [Paraglaciecola agarilytica NO2]|uniref:Uncharacterized protein n=1 Tax=Paraglaciecola agarilytica NO2 TaxID=1125747 RepID=A0ABQ0I0Q6_9ALTE|nr:hypothetical protein GAGA_0025 [Paraglaciecola agarilytica NO2]
MKTGTYTIDVKRNYFHKKPVIYIAKTSFILSDPSAPLPLINPDKTFLAVLINRIHIPNTRLSSILVT